MLSFVLNRLRHIKNEQGQQRLFVMWLMKFRKIVRGNLIVYTKGVVEYHKTARVIIEKGHLFFNIKWNKKDPFPSLLYLGENASLMLKDSFSVYSGARIYINQNSSLVLGSGYINNNVNISCFEKIEIGQDVAISENVCIRDSDNHEIINSSKPSTQPIKIGNRVWIGMNVTILKGVTIGDRAIIGAGSLVNKDVPAGCMAVGVPAKVVKTNVAWR